MDDNLKGIYREYVEALKAGVEARRKYDEVAQSNSPQASSSQEASLVANDLLEDRVTLLKLQTKQDRLSSVQSHLDLLMQKPAAAPEFLEPEDMFRDAASLPPVPKEVVNSLIAQQSTKKADLTDQMAQLEKTVLRAKLLLRREEQLLRETRSNTQNIPDVISNGTRLHALNTTRNELINWIETELGKASGQEDGDEEGEGGTKGLDRSAADQAAVNGQLEAIKDKYARYLSARRSLLATVAEQSAMLQAPVLAPDKDKQQLDQPDPVPTTYLLNPYIETLLSLSRKQKAMITQKAHTNVTLGREIKDACQSLSHISEESQLLPSQSMTTASRRRSGLGEILTSTPAERSGFTGKVQPWVLAADSAKIATLENVAEQVEIGQLALENSMQTLQEIDHLLGQDEAEQGDQAQANTTEDDFWLATGSQTPGKARKHTEKKNEAEEMSKDAWFGLHGNLGLIGLEDAS
ncbi:hypothetical protein ACJ41O_002825 [Fusarium nematophilum]